MPLQREVEPAVTQALAVTQQLLVNELQQRGEQPDTATALLVQAALFRILAIIEQPEFHNLLVAELSHGHLTIATQPASQEYVEMIDAKQLVIRVQLTQNTLQLELPNDWGTVPSKEYTLDLPPKHLGILRLFILKGSETVTTAQIIEHGLANGQNGVTQMISIINAELFTQHAGYLYIESIARGEYKLHVTTKDQIINEFFTLAGLTGKLGRYYLSPGGLYERKGWAPSTEDSKIMDLSGREAEVLGLLIYHKDNVELTLPQITDILHASRSTVHSILNVLQGRFNRLQQVKGWRIQAETLGRNVGYKLLEIPTESSLY